MEWEPEENWLRHRVKRLRTILRFAKEPRAEELLKELIKEADERLAALAATSIGRRRGHADLSN